MNLFQSFALYIIVIVIGCSLLGCTSIIGENIRYSDSGQEGVITETIGEYWEEDPCEN